MSTETKTYVFPDNNSSSGNWMSLLAPLCQQKGVDPNVLLAMNNGGLGGNNGGFLWVIFLLFLMGWNRDGFGGFGNGNGAPLANMLNNDNGREMLLSAIQGNATAISQLATTLNCDVNAIQTAINSVQSAIQSVGNQVGLTGQQVINAVQSGNMQIAQQISNCCCENRLAICQQTNTLQQSIGDTRQAVVNGFAQLGFETQKQTCDLQNSVNAGVQRIIDGQNAAITRELQNRIASQAEEISTYKTTAATSQIIAGAIAPINAALANLTSEVNDIKCKQPQTVTLPYSCATAVPTALAYGYGLNPYSTGQWG